MKPDLDMIAAIVAEIDAALGLDRGEPLDRAPAARAALNALVADHAASHRFAGGTYHLRVAGLAVTSTAGGYKLLSAWTGKARRLLTEAGR